MTAQELLKILIEDKPSDKLIEKETELFRLIPELERCKGFNQNNIWHIYDVYEHILKVIDNVPNDIVLRLSALFHDVGKPITYTTDEKGQGHFYGHWVMSKQIFEKFAKENNLSKDIKDQVDKLIIHHDTRFERLSNDDLKFIMNSFNEAEITNLYILKRADLLAQNPKFHYLLDNYDEEEKKLLNICKGSDSNEYAILKRSKKKN